MQGDPHMHDVVALLEEFRTTHFEHGHALRLQRGQMGTVVMIYDDGTCEVEFADRNGRTYALLSVPPQKLIVLHEAPEQAAA